jgi:23S rRNA (pseudouridine1915-N3)-methyltransferase
MRDKITKYKDKWYRVVLLVKEWNNYTTEQLQKKHIYRNTIFVIGWPYGVEEALLNSVIDDRISLGAHTMPHGLAKLVILEQIYRIQMIEYGRQYHY